MCLIACIDNKVHDILAQGCGNMRLDIIACMDDGVFFLTSWAEGAGPCALTTANEPRLCRCYHSVTVGLRQDVVPEAIRPVCLDGVD